MTTRETPETTPLLDRVEQAIQTGHYSILRGWLAIHGGASARIALEEITQLVRELSRPEPTATPPVLTPEEVALLRNIAPLAGPGPDRSIVMLADSHEALRREVARLTEALAQAQAGRKVRQAGEPGHGSSAGDHPRGGPDRLDDPGRL